MMRPLWLDYQRPAPGRQRSGIALLLVGLLACGLLTADYLSVSSEIDVLDEDVSKLRREVERSARAAAPVVASGEGAAAAPAMPQTDWDGLLAGLERAAAEDVTLLQLRPGRERIEVGGEAKDFAAATAYAGRLQRIPGFSNLQLTQSSVVAEHPQHPLRFTLAVAWGKGAK